MNEIQEAIVARHLSSTCANKSEDGRSCTCANEIKDARDENLLEV